MIFSKLLPHEGNFFELTSRHSDCIVDAARNFCQLVMNYSDRDVRVALAKEVDAAELRANAVAAEFNTALHKTFITPVDREQLHQLIGSMDAAELSFRVQEPSGIIPRSSAKSRSARARR